MFLNAVRGKRVRKIGVQSRMIRANRYARIALRIARATKGGMSAEQSCPPQVFKTRNVSEKNFSPCLASADCKRGRRKGATSKNVKSLQKASKRFSTLFDNFRAGQKTSKIVKKRQKVFRHFATVFARHHFSGRFWGGSDCCSKTSQRQLSKAHFSPPKLCTHNKLQLPRPPTEPRNPENAKMHFTVRKMPFWTLQKNGPINENVETWPFLDIFMDFWSI